MGNTEKMAELIYAELTQGRESTRLPHTHKLTSLKNVVILKLINEYIFKPKCNCRRKSMQEKESIMVVWCKLKVPSLRITVLHHSASLAMLNSYRRDTIFNPQLTAIKNSYNKENVQCSNICYTRIWDIFVHTYVTYENVKWPNLCHTQKYDI